MKVIIVGGGQVGAYLASLLSSNGHEIRIIENRENIYKNLQKELPNEMLIFGNGSDPEVMEKAGIDSADVVAAVTGADETNLVISTLAKMEFGIPKVVARVNNPKNAWLFNSTMGVDIGVNQAELISYFVVEEMNMKDMFTILKLGRGDYSIVQMKVQKNAKAADQLLKNLSISSKTVLIAIIRNESVLIPKGNTQILADDGILALTDENGRKELKKIFS
ncbi:TrkA family potassium uptake protein [Acidilutibacter cellobiosedens]|uniref:Trk system potassium uptake protein TrkA n=1 Tax=Acidilutibacter cellobiosedens TaxID=2507161 RepID=A0A410QEI8_9FIRM|nr:TrkA family potassium uptake protein [Acidilutibacter cellobiosedens]QAT62400.1 TrkA family potassium uptake protein [Acidilutibacter cellobiosedens]